MTPTMSMLRMFLLCTCVLLLAGSATAQLIEPISLELSPPILAPGELGEVTLFGVAYCAGVQSVETTADTVIIVFDTHCAILPPPPIPFEIPVAVGPLNTGVYTVEVREIHDDELLATTTWQVGYPYGTFDLEISPTPVPPGVAAQAIVTGRAPCPRFADLETTGSRIDLLIDNQCGFIPPDPQDFRLVVDLDPLATGAYTLAVRDAVDGVIFALEDFEVAETDTQLELLPAAVATDQDQIVAQLSGFATCPSLRFIEVDVPRIEINYSTGCLFTPPPPPSDFLVPITLGRLDAGDYTVVAWNHTTGEAVTRDLLVVASAPPLRFEPESPTDSEAVTAFIGLPGVEVCDPMPLATISADRILIQVDDSCVAVPPGVPGQPVPVTSIPAQLPPLGADTYDVEVRGNGSSLLARGRLDVRTSGACTPSPTVLCLQGGRFEVQVDYTSNAGAGAAQATQETNDSGSFTFFDEDNVELVVKVLDACGTAFRSYWFFAAGVTNVRVDLRVRDTETDEVRFYANPRGRTFRTILDNRAFFTCR